MVVFNLIVGRTDIAGLIGPNGAGKTTVFTISRTSILRTPRDGPADGRDTLRKEDDQVSRMCIARTVQNTAFSVRLPS